MTNQEYKDIVQMFGPNYEESDVPAYIRQRDFERALVGEQLAEEFRQEEIQRREKERLEAL